MKIVVENSGYGLDNLGDVAMLQVAVERLKALWPSAKFFVITSDQEKLSFYIPDAIPIDLEQKRAWLSKYNVIGGIHHLFPKKLKKWLSTQEQLLRVLWPSFSLGILSLRFGKDSPKYLSAKGFVDKIKEADLVIATGGGYVNDTFWEHSSQLFDVLLLAQKFEIPTAMVGQGLGPISNKLLLKQFKRVFLNLELISMREGKFSPELLEKSIAKNNVAIPKRLTTGDDAIEKAFKLRAEKMGMELGLNIRNANYANLPDNVLAELGSIVRSYVDTHNLNYQLLPISMIKGISDIEALEKLLQLELDNSVQASLEVNDIIHRIAKCRVVITGSYHAALFALSQGIQVIGLTASKYYDNKFLGLLHQFEYGVQIVYLNENIEVLPQYIETAWQRAEFQRERLLESAKSQINQGMHAYTSLYELITNKM